MRRSAVKIAKRTTLSGSSASATSNGATELVSTTLPSNVAAWRRTVAAALVNARTATDAEAATRRWLS